MDIVHIVQRYPPARGGSEAYFARLSRWLAGRGQCVHVATTAAKDLTAFWDRRATTVPPGIRTEDGVAVERHPLWRVPLQRWLLRGLSLLPVPSWQGWVMSCNPLSWSLRRWARTYAGPCDLVHATAFPYGWPLRCALTLARRRRVPFVLTPFLHLGDPAERVVLQGLGVAVAECTGGDRAGWRAHGIAPDEVVVGHLANLSREKGSNARVAVPALEDLLGKEDFDDCITAQAPGDQRVAGGRGGKTLCCLPRPPYSGLGHDL